VEREFVTITGAGKRLGCMIAAQFLESGYSVLAHYRSDKSELDSWLKIHTQYSERVCFCKADLKSNMSTLKKSMKEVDGKLVGLINSASVFEKGDLLNIESFRSQLEINSLVPLELSSVFTSLCDDGFIINMIDANIRRVNCNFQSYRTSKLLLEEITRQLSVVCGPNIRVNGVSPGTVLPPVTGVDESYQKALDSAPLKKIGTVESILRTIQFLVDSKDITGEIIRVDSGVHSL
jgi:pteridine reductase